MTWQKVLHRVRGSHGDDRGITLVELIVSGAITVMLLAMIATLFVRTMQVNGSVLGTATTTNDAKVQFDRLQSLVRLAVDTDVRKAPDLVNEPSGGVGDVLIIKARQNQGAVASAGTWKCVGWYLDTTGKLRSIQGPASASTPVTRTSPSTWPVAVDGVTTHAGASTFTALESDPGTPAWYPGSVGVVMTFEEAEAHVPVKLAATIAPRRQLQLDGEVSGGSSCTP